MNRQGIASIACCLVVAASVLAESPLADRLPAETKAYVGWTGRNLPFDGSMFGQLINEPAVKAILSAIHDAATKEIGSEQERKTFEAAWDLVATGWQHPIAAALFDLQPGPEDLPRVSAALLIDLGKEKEAFDKQLTALLAAIGPDLELTNATVGSVTYRTQKIENGNDVSLGYIGETFFFTIGTDTPGTLIRLSPPKSLRADKKFAAAMKSVDGENVQLAMYLNVEALSKDVRRLAAETGATGGGAGDEARMQAISEATGLNKATAMAGTVRVVDRGMHTKVRLFTPAPHTGLLLPLAGKPLKDDDLADVPDDADFLLAANVSAEAFYAELRRILKACNEEADAEFAKALGEVEDEYGFSLTRDILANLADRWVISSAPSQGGFLTGTVISAQAKDAAKLREALAKIESSVRKKFAPTSTQPAEGAGRTAAAIETVKSGRTDIRYLSFAGVEPIPLAPAWTVHKDRLYLAGWPQVIQTVIEGDRKPITQDPAFRQARAKVAANASVLMYANYPRILRQVYNLALVGWTAGANALSATTGVTARADWLPALSKLEKYLWPEIAAVSADPEGITFEAYGSMPSVCPFSLPVGASLASILIPTVTHAQRMARQSVEMNNLRMIGVALQMYCVDHGGDMPESLQEEKLADYLGGRDSTIWKDIKADKYVYRSRMRGRNVAPDAVVLYFKPAAEDRNVLVCLRDGAVQVLTREQFEQRVKD